MENAPAKDGSIFLISERKRDVLLAVYTLKPRIGMPLQESDHLFISHLKICSQARSFLENMRPSRMSGKVSRTLSQKEIEEKFERILVSGGEKALNKLREEAKFLAIKLHLKDEYKKLDMLIGTLLGTKEGALLSEITISRTKGLPYDAKRADFFENFYSVLKNLAPQSRLRLNPTEGARTNAFYDPNTADLEGIRLRIE
ncbi:MAG: hypothetical protein K2P93_08905 [Alphaproteobacteria bacterium]|nr:hypothetical protein [Alphaproteobacteria bacterium]